MKEIFIGSSKEALTQATQVAQILSEAPGVRPVMWTEVFKVGDITFMDSGGINALLRARALLGREDRTLTLVRPSRAVRRTLETAGIADLFALTHR